MDELTLRALIRDELKTYDHDCKVFMTDQAIQDFKDNQAWLKLQRQRSDVLANIILGVFVTAICGGLISALWLGVKALVQQ